jgi:prepilin-type N-terminal cleavage/methylation domain-containing protein
VKRAFSLVELVIVAAIIGILAALVIPYFQHEAMEAKEVAAKDNLRMLRGAIELYAARHAGMAPGYADGGEPDAACFCTQTVADGCLRQMPENPFNNLDTMLLIADGGPFPAQATGQCGWIYQPGRKTIRLDWPGRDAKGTRYIDY